jgi:hypothetical protein
MHIVKVPPGCVFARCGCTWWIASIKGEVGVRACKMCGRIVHEPSPDDLEHCEIEVQFVTYEEWQNRFAQKKKVAPEKSAKRVKKEDKEMFKNDTRTTDPNSGMW